MSWVPGNAVSLTTERFDVRSLTTADVTERYLAWSADPELNRTLNRLPTQVSVQSLRRYVAAFDNRSGFHLGVFDRTPSSLIGVYSINCDLTHAQAKLHVLIGERAYWGKRVVLESCAAVLDFLFDEVGIEKAWGGPYGRNFPAIFNYQAQGFRCEGVLRQHVRAVDGSGRLDQYLFAMLRDEWHARRREGTT